MRRITSRTKPFRPDLGSNSLLMPSPRSAGLPRGWLWLRVELLQAGCHYRLKRSPLDLPRRIPRRLELLRAAAQDDCACTVLHASRHRVPLESAAAPATPRQSDSKPTPVRAFSASSITRKPCDRCCPSSHSRADRRPPTSRNNETFSSVAEAPSRNHRRAADSCSKCPPRHREITASGRGRRIGRDRASVRRAPRALPAPGESRPSRARVRAQAAPRDSAIAAHPLPLRDAQ